MALIPGAFGFGLSDPFVTDPVDRSIDRAFNRMMNSMLGPTSLAPPTGTRSSGAVAPGAMQIPMDIIETEGAYEIHCDAPGMRPSDVRVELTEGELGRGEGARVSLGRLQVGGQGLLEPPNKVRHSAVHASPLPKRLRHSFLNVSARACRRCIITLRLPRPPRSPAPPYRRADGVRPPQGPPRGQGLPGQGVAQRAQLLLLLPRLHPAGERQPRQHLRLRHRRRAQGGRVGGCGGAAQYRVGRT